MSVTYAMIRDLPTDERPRERLERFGPGSLGTPELLAIILRVGNARVSALQLAQQLIVHCEGLRGVAAASVQELSEIPGIGLAKACQLKAAFELGKRLAVSSESPRPIISSPLDAVNLVMEEMRYYPEEHFKTFFLDTRHQVLGFEETTKGTLNASVVHPREVFKPAIARMASAVLMAHNHPSGDPTPSKEDLALTARLIQTGEVIGIPVIDHLIIGDGRYVSMKDKGIIK